MFDHFPQKLASQQIVFFFQNLYDITNSNRFPLHYNSRVVAVINNYFFYAIIVPSLILYLLKIVLQMLTRIYKSNSLYIGFELNNILCTRLKKVRTKSIIINRMIHYKHYFHKFSYSKTSWALQLKERLKALFSKS